jgi:DNA-binding NarL/FixJ family response regulator
VSPLSPAQLQALVDHLHLAVFVFNHDRIVYQNATGLALLERLRREYGIELLVMIRDHLENVRRQAGALFPGVTLLTPPSGESFHVRVRELPACRGERVLAVTVREVGIEREAFRRRYGLSRRETQVVELLLRGYGNRDIAATLGIALGTTKKHLTRVFDKVGVDTRVRLLSRMA